MPRDFGPFPSKPMYEVVNRRMQKALAVAASSTGFVTTGQGAVTAGTGAQLVIAAYPDGALVDGLYVENPTSETVTLTTNTGSTNPRIDRLVLRLDMGAQTIAPFQIVGTPASSPTAPPLVQTSTVFDMPLCQYRFPGSGSAQNPGSIVDERVWARTSAAYPRVRLFSTNPTVPGNGTLYGIGPTSGQYAVTMTTANGMDRFVSQRTDGLNVQPGVYAVTYNVRINSGGSTTARSLLDIVGNTDNEVLSRTPMTWPGEANGTNNTHLFLPVAQQVRFLVYLTTNGSTLNVGFNVDMLRLGDF